MFVIDKVYSILPITKLVVETASFDIQKIKNPDIQPEEYQQGEQLGFWNVREYVLFRDGHVCQCCKGKSKDKILNVHHIESRKVGGNAPNNLITLCETCHRGFHDGVVKLPSKIKRGMSFRDAKKRNQTDFSIFGYQLYDRVVYQGRQYFVFGRRKTGYFDIRTLSGDKVNKGSISYKKLRLLEHVHGYLVERRSCFPLMTEVTSLQTA